MRVVQLGNVDAWDNGRPIPGNQVTNVVIPDERSDGDAIRDIVHPDGLWNVHSRQLPAWVESNSEALAERLSEIFGCPIGRPDNW